MSRGCNVQRETIATGCSGSAAGCPNLLMDYMLYCNCVYTVVNVSLSPPRVDKNCGSGVEEVVEGSSTGKSNGKVGREM